MSLSLKNMQKLFISFLITLALTFIREMIKKKFEEKWFLTILNILEET